MIPKIHKPELRGTGKGKMDIVNENLEIDRTRILASLFWIGGALLTLAAALGSYRQDCAAAVSSQTGTKRDSEEIRKLSNEIERMKKLCPKLRRG